MNLLRRSRPGTGTDAAGLGDTGALSVDFQNTKDATRTPDASSGGMLPLSSICYVVVLTTAFCALVFFLHSGAQGSTGVEVSVWSHPFTLPLQFRPPLEQPLPAINGKAKESIPSPKDGSMVDRCAGRYIHMYDLPPRFNNDLVRGCSRLRRSMDLCPYVTNCGMGQALGDDEVGIFAGRGWYATDQFMLDIIFRGRMKRYPCLTSDPSLAAAVFVPFYASLDAGKNPWNHTTVRDALALDLVEWLVRRPEWRAMGGRDHFLVAGRTTGEFHRMTEADEEWGTKLLNIPAVRNMTALVLETRHQWHRTEFAVPYPTYFHPETAADVAAWQETVRRAERKWLFAFVGAPRPGKKETAREEIIRQCGASSRCNHLHCTVPSGSKPSSCESMLGAPGAVMSVFKESTFCLEPPGGTPTRRSTFDAILAGCIPVFFHPDSAYSQYTNHLPKDPNKYSVLIMHTDVTGPRNVSIEERLSRIPQDTVAAMREEVIRLIPKVVYADPRSRYVDFEDAVAISLRVVIDRVAKRRRNADG